MPNSTLAQMSFLDEDTQQEAVYDIEDTQARSDISTINSKIPSNASSNNKLATKSDVSAAYIPGGNAELATLPPLTSENLNRVFNMIYDFITNSDFVEGAGKSVKAGNEVGIVNVGTSASPVIKYTVFGGFFDTSSLQPKDLENPIEVAGVERDTVEDALFALSTDKEDTILTASPLVKEYDEVMRQDIIRLTQDDTPTDNSNNPVKSSGIKSALDATVDLMKDTTGWIGKNLLPPKIIQLTTANSTLGNNTFASLDCCSFVMPIEHNTDYIASHVGGNRFRVALSMDEPNVNGDCNLLVSDETLHEYTFNSGNYNYVLFYTQNTAGDVNVIKPMICTAEQYDLSPTYRPYHESVEEEIQDIYDFNAKTGVHQLLDNTAVSKTEDTVTFTVNADKTVDIVTSAVTTANANLKMTNPRMNSDNLPVGTYRASKKTTNPNICMYVNAYNNTSYVKQLLFLTTEAEGLFTVDYNGYNFIEIGLTVPTGREIPTSTKAEPLITYPEDKSNLITPPAMTNRELTGAEDTVSLKSGLSVWTINKVVKYGKVCTLNLSVTASTAITTPTLIGTFPTGFRPKAIIFVPVGHPNYSGVAKIDTNGEITFTPPTDASVTNICIVTTFIL